MDYEEKYKEALGWMQSLYKGLHGITKEDAEHYFPELKSEDERIRKVLLNDFKNNCSEYYCEGVDRNMIIAWLEKQGKKLNPDKVIGWLKTKVYDDSAYGMAMIEQFKKDFQL